MKYNRKILNPNFLYFILPLTYVYICVITAINYILMKDIKEALKTLTYAAVISICFYMLIPYILYIFGFNILSHYNILVAYFYIISTLVGIYFIKKQQKYITIKNI